MTQYFTPADSQKALANAATLDEVANGNVGQTVTSPDGREYPTIAEALDRIQQVTDNAELTAAQKYDQIQALIIEMNTDLQVAKAAGAGANGWTDSLIALLSGRTQREKNSDTVSVFDYFTASERTAYAADQGNYNATAAIQRAINNIVPGRELDFLGLTFAVGSKLSINNKTNFVLKNGAIKALPGMVTNTENQMLFLNLCSRFSLQNFNVDANRSQRTPAEVAIHSIVLRSCKYFTFTNVAAPNAVCDGLYIDSATPTNLATLSKNGVFINCDFDNAYRNCCSIIAAQDLLFKSCTFTNANGTAPQSGLDIETNSFGVTGLINNIAFEGCTFAGNNGWQFQSTIYDAPRGIRITGGTVTSNRGLNTASNSGGILVANDDTVIDGVLFKDFTANSGYCVRVHAEPGAYAKVLKCNFTNIASNGTIEAHLLSDGCIVDNCRFTNAAGMSLYAANSLIKNSIFKNPTGIAIYSGSTGGIVEVNNCTIRGGVGRAIFLESVNAKVINNKIYDVTSPVYYIQAGAAGAVVEDNRCVSSTPMDTQKAIRFSGTAGARLRYNTCTNFHLTDPYDIQGGIVSAKVEYNIGGTANGALKNRNVITYAQTATLPAVPANSTAQLAVTVSGVTVGMLTRCSFALGLAGTRIWAEVTNTNAVTVYRRNDTASALPELTAQLNIACELINS